MPPPLPPSYHWLDTAGGSYLRRNAAGVATVIGTGRKWLTKVQAADGTTREALAASREQGKRWVTLWVSAQLVPRNQAASAHSA